MTSTALVGLVLGRVLVGNPILGLFLAMPGVICALILHGKAQFRYDGNRKTKQGTGLTCVMVVLTPLAMFDGALEPPPFRKEPDTGVLIPAFASDLARLNGYSTAALSRPLGDIT